MLVYWSRHNVISEPLAEWRGGPAGAARCAGVGTQRQGVQGSSLTAQARDPAPFWARPESATAHFCGPWCPVGVGHGHAVEAPLWGLKPKGLRRLGVRLVGHLADPSATRRHCVACANAVLTQKVSAGEQWGRAGAQAVIGPCSLIWRFACARGGLYNRDRLQLSVSHGR